MFQKEITRYGWYDLSEMQRNEIETQVTLWQSVFMLNTAILIHRYALGYCVVE